MAPRRGGRGSAGAEVAGSSAGRNSFEPPPMKRLSAWAQDGSDQCDVIAGGVDESGQFKGVYVSGVHLMALMRTFQLSKVFMPTDVAPPIGWLGQSLQDGVPLIIVTRGCFGREMDYGPGPVRNDVQKTIWQLARNMRAEMPQILITCIDIPSYLGSDALQACMEQPLNEYRELMYQDGTWFTPTVVNAGALGKWVNENTRHKAPEKVKSMKSQFNRKKFDWQDSSKFYGNMWCISWKAVLEVHGAPEVPRRNDLKFSPETPVPEVPYIKLPPSTAEVAFKKALTKARDAGDAKEMLAATTVYLEKAYIKETESLQEATKACDEAADLFKAKSEEKEAMGAVGMKFKALVSMNSLDEAMKVATEALASSKEPLLKVKALKMAVTAHQMFGDLDKAVEAAIGVKADVLKVADDEASCEALQILIDAYLAQGDTDAAIAAASEGAKGKVEAFSSDMLAVAKLAKAAEVQTPADAKALAKEAAEAQQKAAKLYMGLKQIKEANAALKGAAEAFIKASEFVAAASVAKELQEAGKGTNDKAVEATGMQLVAKALLGSTAATTGGSAEMLASARSALAIFEEAGDMAGKAGTMEVLAEALLLEGLSLEEAYKMAKAAAKAYKALKQTDSTCTALLLASKVALKRGSFNSAYWDAKQVVSEGTEGAGYSEAVGILGQVLRMSEDMGKPISVGGPVPVVTGDGITYA